MGIQLGVLRHIGTHPHTDKIGYENRDFEAIRPPLMSETTPLKQRLKFIKVADNERLMRSRAENTEKKRLKPLFRGLIGGVWRYEGERRNKAPYPTFAVSPVLAAPAVFSNLCSSSLMRCSNRPISLDCSTIVCM